MNAVDFECYDNIIVCRGFTFKFGDKDVRAYNDPSVLIAHAVQVVGIHVHIICILGTHVSAGISSLSAQTNWMR